MHDRRSSPIIFLLKNRVFYLAVGTLVAILIPLLVQNSYVLDIADDMIIWAILTVGLNVVVGFAGLLDLGYIAFFAIGGYTFGILGSKLGMNMWEAIPIAAILVLVASVIIGIPTLRLKSDYLAIMTLGFGEIIYLSVNNLNSITGGPNGLYDMPSPSIFGLSLQQPSQYYWFLLILLAIAIVAIARLRSSHVGRAWLAVRQDELAARATGVNIVKYKLLAYMVGALWAGVVGVLFAAKQTIVSPTSFQFSQSFYVLSSVIIGGMGSIPGAIAGGFLFILISETLQGMAQNYSSIVFSVALLGVILLRPKGLIPASVGRRGAGLPSNGRTAGALTVRPALATENGVEAEVPTAQAAPDERRSADRPARAGYGGGGALLEVHGVSVTFGGVRAVREVSLAVAPQEIVSVIGPNGAGKTTLLNIISGFVRPADGRVELSERDITRLRVDRRAQMGLARTFQTPRLLPTLSVVDNIIQGGHINFTTEAPEVAVGTGRQRREEHAAREEAIELLAMLGLSNVADTIPTQLSYGDQRRCEVARCLALHPKIILLDEPAAGMNAQETAALGDLLFRVRGLGVALLLIDHDMSLVRKVSDRVSAMDRGATVVTGDVETVLHHPEVVRSYLGT